MSPRRPQSVSIVWPFAITSLIVFALIGLGIALVRTGDLRARSEQAATVRAELIAQGIVAPLLTSDDVVAPIRGPRYAELDRAIEEFAIEDTDVVRVKVWRRDGTILFSNDPGEVGFRPELEEDLEHAFEGEVESEISNLDAEENRSERKLADQLFETYVPVNLSGATVTDHVDAVIEIYQDYSSIRQEIDRLNHTLTVSLGLGLLALYVLLLPVLVGTTRMLRRQNAQLKEQAEQLSIHLEREQETVAELRELDRLKGDFVAAASHELRTPLTTIRGFAELLQEGYDPADPVMRDATETILRQTAHLQRLVANLLREAKLEQGSAIGASMSTSVEGVLHDVRDAFPGSVARIELSVGSDLPTLPADPMMLHEIVANLVDNALKYSAPDTTVHVSARREDAWLVIRVRDRGEGIAPGDLPRIFDRFTQLDQSSTRTHGGVGLGLHLVRELTRRLGGEVAVESAVGTGTVFTVTIPVEALAAPAENASPSEMTRA